STFPGFSGFAALNTTGLPTGTAASFSPSSLNTDGTSSTLTVAPSPSTTAGDYPFTLIATNGNTSLTLQATLTVTPAVPIATLTPTSLTFAGQNVGATSASQAITLSNNGTVPLLVSNIATSGDFAQTNNCGSTVGVNASCTISITFTPTALGSRSGNLII